MNRFLIEKAKQVNLMDLVIGQDYPYTQAHDHIKIVCPFHDERTPSLAIYSDHYYCFACSENGDPITWVQKLYKKTFKEAVEILSKYNDRRNR